MLTYLVVYLCSWLFECWSHQILFIMQNFVFSTKFDAAAQYNWISVSAFSMVFDLLAFSAIRILMIWTFPNSVIVIALFVFMVGTILFATFCGDSAAEDGSLIVLTCTTTRI